MGNIYCLLWNGHNLTEEVRNELFLAAQWMFREEKAFIKLKDGCCKGEIFTEWASKAMGSAVGTAFKAWITWDGGECEVEFICRECDISIDQLKWMRLLLPSDDAEVPLHRYNPN